MYSTCKIPIFRTVSKVGAKIKNPSAWKNFFRISLKTILCITFLLDAHLFTNN